MDFSSIGIREIIAVILGICAILYVLEKYLKIDPLGKGFNGFLSILGRIMRKFWKYNFIEFTHLNDPVLLKLIEDFNQENYREVEKTINTLSPSYRSFAFRCLGQNGKLENADNWINGQDSVLAKVIKSYQIIHEAWEVRGRGTIDTVSKKNRELFQKYLADAEQLLLEAKQEKSEYLPNINASLIKIYRAMYVEREKIHGVFQEADQGYPNHTELNFNYFSAISYKWGGTEEELNRYFDTLDDRPLFIQYLVLAQFYRDLLSMADYEDEDGKIVTFVNNSLNLEIDKDELYRFELYLLLYWTSDLLDLKKQTAYFKNLIQPYWNDDV
ncbi:MAG: hypothetical protein MJB14_04965 [Spirochaetes bacterium]|nr:hypothetical protein [Spirochaetota bacterium]